MRLVGVIAEYDPFHRGHAWQLRQAREKAGADAVVVVMSAAFTQRGSAAMLAPRVRAEMALRGGADAVIALPALWSLRDGEHFALAGVSLLQGLGCDALSFGAEEADVARLRLAAHVLEEQPEDYRRILQQELRRGNSWARASAAALEAVQPGLGACVSQPNNLLGISYLRALERLQASMEVFPVLRKGSYHAAAPGEAEFASASAVRAAVHRGDWLSVRNWLPEDSAVLLERAAREGQLAAPNALDQALLYRLRTMTEAEWQCLPGLSEGIEGRLQKAARSASTVDELLRLAVCARYPAARLRRMGAHALLGITREMTEATPLPPAALLLGLRREVPGLQARLAQGQIPLLSRAAEYPEADWLKLEERAWDVQALSLGLGCGTLRSGRLVTL